MTDIEDSPLLIVRNTQELTSKKTSEVYPFITSNGKILAFRSDDDKAAVLYGAFGEVVPADDAPEGSEFEIRDHRQDEDSDTDADAVLDEE